MFLQKPITPEELRRFNEGFGYYWDVYSAITPELNEIVYDLVRQPLVIDEFKRYGVEGEVQLTFRVVKAISLMIFTLGFDNVEDMLNDQPITACCALAGMVCNDENLDPDGPMGEYNITATIISTVLCRQARDHHRDAKGFLQQALESLHLPGWLHGMLKRHFSKQLASWEPVASLH